MKVALAGLLGSLIALSACADWKASGSSKAPDGRTIAEIQVSLAGAPADNRTRIVIRNGNGGGLPEPVYAVEAKNAIVGFTRLRWVDANHLQVTLCDATSYHVRSENLRNPPYLDSDGNDGTGDPNAVWVEVINLSYSLSEKACLPYSKAA
jgi:hypothetical protein